MTRTLAAAAALALAATLATVPASGTRDAWVACVEAASGTDASLHACDAEHGAQWTMAD